MDQLIDYGEVRRGRLGVAVQDLTPALAEALDVRSSRGAVVTQVEAGSPAALAGLRPGDVIVEINRQPIDDATDLRNLVGMSEIGGGLDIIFYREGQERRLSTQVGRIEASP
jgi:S1-C subfamily serine protease